MTEQVLERPVEVVTLNGKHALVTGASSGIGRAAAMALAKHGVHVHLAGRRLETLAMLAEDIGSASVHRVDLFDETATEALAGRLEGRIDLLIHCAGGHYLGGIADVPVQALDELYAVNVRAPYQLTRRLLPTLIACQGQIVFCNSTAGLHPNKEAIAYTATKHALRALTEGLRAEVNPYGVRVLSLFPGRTNTPMQESIFEQEGRTYMPDLLLQPEDIASVIVHTLMLPRTAEVTELVIRPMKKV